MEGNKKKKPPKKLSPPQKIRTIIIGIMIDLTEVKWTHAHTPAFSLPLDPNKMSTKCLMNKSADVSGLYSQFVFLGGGSQQKEGK